MNRLTKLEIQSALLEGRKLEWVNATGKRETIELGTAAQRRLFAFLVRSSVREPKGLSDDFVSGLADTYAVDIDPAKESGEAASSLATGPWRLQRIETEGFGGLNICGGPVFSYDFDGESLGLRHLQNCVPFQRVLRLMHKQYLLVLT